MYVYCRFLVFYFFLHSQVTAKLMKLVGNCKSCPSWSPIFTFPLIAHNIWNTSTKKSTYKALKVAWSKYVKVPHHLLTKNFRCSLLTFFFIKISSVLLIAKKVGRKIAFYQRILFLKIEITNKSANCSIYIKQTELCKQVKSKKHKWVKHTLLRLASSDCFCHSICNIAKFVWY